MQFSQSMCVYIQSNLYSNYKLCMTQVNPTCTCTVVRYTLCTCTQTTCTKNVLLKGDIQNVHVMYKDAFGCPYTVAVVIMNKLRIK